MFAKNVQLCKLISLLIFMYIFIYAARVWDSQRAKDMLTEVRSTFLRKYSKFPVIYVNLFFFIDGKVVARLRNGQYS